MLSKLAKSIRKNRFVTAVFFPPKHIRTETAGTNFEECLRQLEKENNLPNGDLSVDFNNPREVASFPLGLKSTSYSILSKTSELWRKDPDKEGYISGSILKSKKELLGLSVLARLHISKNCPGVYGEKGCLTCGDIG